MRRHTQIMGIIFIALISIGFLFKALKYPGAGAMLGFGIILFIVGFAVSFTIDKISLEKN